MKVLFSVSRLNIHEGQQTHLAMIIAHDTRIPFDCSPQEHDNWGQLVKADRWVQEMNNKESIWRDLFRLSGGVGLFVGDADTELNQITNVVAYIGAKHNRIFFNEDYRKREGSNK